MTKDNIQLEQTTLSSSPLPQQGEEKGSMEGLTLKLPSTFTDYTRKLFGDNLYKTFLKGLEEAVPVSIRLNPFKLSVENHKINPVLHPQPISWCKEGYWLEKRPNFTFDPLLHAGVYYVQEASSMFLSHVLRHWVKQPFVLHQVERPPAHALHCL